MGSFQQDQCVEIAIVPIDLSLILQNSHYPRKLLGFHCGVSAVLAHVIDLYYGSYEYLMSKCSLNSLCMV